MHVALISTSSIPVPPPRYGGTELVIAELAQALVALGHDVTTYATSDSHPAGAVRSYFDHAMWPPDPQLDLVHAHHACADLARLNPRVDVVHAHTPAALAFGADLGVPMVYTLHHTFEQRWVEFYRYFKQIQYVSISHRQRELFASLPNVSVVHHGLDSRSFTPGDGAGGYVAFVGRLAAEKGPTIAIDVARAAHVPLLVAGDAHPHELEFFHRDFEPRLGLDGVRWIGEVDHAAKETLLGGARAMLFPIDWEEPFGLVMIESMMCGTPVIALRRGSVGEVVEHGLTGFVVDRPDEMIEAIRQIDSLDRGVVRRRAEAKWSSTRMAMEYLEVYRASIERRRKAPTRRLSFA